MDLICCFGPTQFCRGISISPSFDNIGLSAVNSFPSTQSLRFGFPATPFLRTPKLSFEIYAKKNKKKSSYIEEMLFEEVEEDDEEEEQVLPEEIQDELLVDDEFDDDFDLDEEFNVNEEELYAGDGGGGGGIKLAGTVWDKEALTLAEKVCSPTMEDIEAYSKSYRAKLAEAELAKAIPDSISLEVSSPGVERVVRIPQDLDRYKERPMYVRYTNEDGETEGDGIFRLVSFDVVAKSCIWGIADTRVNREKAGKGRPLSKKQREWRLETAFESLRLIRLHSEC